MVSSRYARARVAVWLLAAGLAVTGCDFEKTTTAIGVQNDALTQQSQVNLAFTQVPGTVAAGASASFAVLATSASSGLPIPGALVSVSSNSGAASFTGQTDATGTFQGSFPSFATKTGSYVLTAALAGGGASTLAPCDVTAGPPAALSFAPSPAPTSVAVGTALSFSVAAVDAWQNPVPSLSLLASSGSQQISATTSSTGQATIAFPVFSTQLGSYAVRVTTPANASLSLTTQLTVTAGAPSVLVFPTQPQGAVAGATLPLFTIGAQDSFGNPTAILSTSRCSLALASAPAGASIGGTYQSVAPGSNGQVTFSAVTLAKAGPYTFQPSCTGVAGTSAPSNSLTITTGTASAITISSLAPTSVTGGQSFTVPVTVTDSQSNPESSGTVALTLSGPTGATLSGPATATVGANGVATFSGLSIAALSSGTYTLSFTSGSATPGTLNLVVTAAPIISSFAASPSAVTAGTPVTLSWSVAEAVSVSITGVATVFPGGSGSTQVSPDASTTYTLTATNATSNQSTATAGVTVSQKPVGSLTFLSQPGGGSGPGFAAGMALPTLTVGALDTSNNAAPLVSGTSCSLTVVSGPSGSPTGLTTSTSAGVATFASVVFQTAGTYTLSASCAGISVPAVTSESIPIAPAAPNRIAITTPPPSTLTTSQTFGFTATAYDPYGNTVTSGTASVSIVSQPGGGSLTGSQSVTISSGNATFSGLGISSITGGNYTLQVAVGTATGNTAPIALTVVPTSISFQLPPTNGTAGAPLGGFALQGLLGGAQVPIADGTSCSLSFTATEPSDPLPGTGLTATASGGLVTFSAATLFTQGSYALSASCPSLGVPAVTSATFQIAPGPLASLTFSPAPPQGASLNQQFGVGVAGLDQYGNQITSSTTAVALLLLSAPSGVTLHGPASVTMANGLATFSGLSLSGSANGNVILRFTAGGFTLPSSAINYQFAPPITGTFVPIPQSLSTYTSLPSNNVNAVVSSGGNLYVATSNGIGISSNGGQSFAVKTAANGLFDNSISKLAVLGNTIVASSNAGPGLALSTNGGQSFSSVAQFAQSTILEIAASSSAIYVVSFVDSFLPNSLWGSPSLTLSVVTEGGTTFQNLPVTFGTNLSNVGENGEPDTPYPNFSPLTVASDGTTLYLAGTSQYTSNSGTVFPSGLSVSTNGGTTFTPVAGLPSADPVIQVSASGEMLYVSVAPTVEGAVGGLWVSSNGGATFGVQGASDLVPAFAVTSSGTIYSLALPWSSGASSSGGPLSNPSPLPPGITSSQIAVSTDGGAAYTYTPFFDLGANITPEGGIAASGTDAFAWGFAPPGGSGPGVDYTSNSGSSFSSVSNLGSYFVSGQISFVNGVAYGMTPSNSGADFNEGLFTLSTTTGQPQNPMLAPNSPGASASFAPAGTGWFVSYLYEGSFYLCNSTLSSCSKNTTIGSSVGGGVNSVDIASFGSTIYALWARDSTFGLSVSTDAGKTFTDTKTWTEGGTYTGGTLFVASNGQLYVALDYVGVLTSTDQGSTFTTLPAFPAVEYQALYVDSTSNSIYIVALGQNAVGENTYQVGASLDGGKTLVKGETFSDVEDIAEQNGTIFISEGSGLQWSVDEGQSFTPNGNFGPAFMVSGLSVLNGTLFVTIDNDLYGKELYYSKDGGNTFSEITGLDMGGDPIISSGYVYSMAVAGPADSTTMNVATGQSMTANPVLYQAPAP